MCARGMAVRRDDFCCLASFASCPSFSACLSMCGGHTGAERELNGPQTALPPSSRVCPDPRPGSARSGPRPIGHVDRHFRHVVAQAYRQALDPGNLAKLWKTLLLGVFMMGRSAQEVQLTTNVVVVLFWTCCSRLCCSLSTRLSFVDICQGQVTFHVSSWWARCCCFLRGLVS